MIPTFRDYGAIPRSFSGKCYLTYSKVFCLVENGQFHCETAPAVLYHDNTFYEWYYRGELHRLDGPATTMEHAIGNNGNGSFYVFGVRYPQDKYWKHPLVLEYRLKLIMEMEG